MANKISAIIEVDAKGGIKSVGELTKGLEEAESAGKLVAAAIAESADKIEADLKGTATAADALGKALGPEMAAKVGENGLIDIVSDLKKLGLTSDEIVTDVDELAASIKQLDAAGSSLNGPKQGLKDVGDTADHAKGQIKNLGGESDNSRSVLANMVGNSAQDVANLGGVAGTAGMALGQLGEYATEGNISLQGLAKVAGPMAAVTLVTMAITSSLEAMRAVDAFNTKKVDAFTEALKEGKTAAQAWDAALTEGGNVEWVDSWGKVSDLVPVLDRAGISWDVFSTHAKAGAVEFEAWARSIDSAGDPASKMKLNDLNALLQAGTQFFNDQAAAVSLTEAQYRVLGDTEALAAQRTREYEAQVDQTEGEVSRSIDEMQAKWDELNGKINGEKSMIQYRQQVADVRQAIMDAGAAEVNFGVGSPEAMAAKENARLKTLDLESTTADLGETILGLPPEKVTELVAEIDRHDLDNLDTVIQGHFDNHTYRVSAHVDNIVVDGETHAAGAVKVGNASISVRGARASGGPVDRGAVYEVAEGGRPEMFTQGNRNYLIPGGDGKVTPFAAAGLGGGVNVVVNVAGSVVAENDLAVTLADKIIDAQRRGVIPAGAFQ